jgi:hypothetical protein
MRRQRQVAVRGSSRVVPARLVRFGALALMLLASRVAVAQATAPPPASAPPVAAPPVAAPPAAAPFEAGDTAPPPGVQPVVPPGTVVPLPPAAEPGLPSPATAPLVVPVPPAPRDEPLYRRDWFWGAVGVLVLTGAIILAVSLSSADPSTPNTKLGDMRAF